MRLLNHRTVSHVIDDIWPPGEPVLLAQINFCLLSGHMSNVQVTIHLFSLDILSVDLSSSKERGHDKYDISYCPTDVFLVGLRTVYTSWWCFGRCGCPLDVPTMPQTTLSPYLCPFISLLPYLTDDCPHSHLNCTGTVHGIANGRDLKGVIYAHMCGYCHAHVIIPSFPQAPIQKGHSHYGYLLLVDYSFTRCEYMLLWLV